MSPFEALPSMIEKATVNYKEEREKEMAGMRESGQERKSERWAGVRS